MSILSIVMIVAGLALFEIVCSIDNAIINAEVLKDMQSWARRWFLLWGFILAVFVVRGVLPWLLVWRMSPELGPWGAVTATFSSDPSVKEAIEKGAPILLLGGGIYFIFLFFRWLFLEPKAFGFPGEKFFSRKGAVFFALISVVLATIVWFALKQRELLAFGAVAGSSAFFLTHGFREYEAKENEERLKKSENGFSDFGRLLYLEVLDASFSIDGVVGAFAFTFSVPLILVANGLGAFVVRQLTVGNIDRIKRYPFLKNGAMYSIFILGCIMLADGFGAHVPEWVSPVATFCIVSSFFIKSLRYVRKNKEEKT